MDVTRPSGVEKDDEILVETPEERHHFSRRRWQDNDQRQNIKTQNVSLCTGDKRDQICPVAGSCEQGDESSCSTQRTVASRGLFNRVSEGESADGRACACVCTNKTRTWKQSILFIHNLSFGKKGKKCKVAPTHATHVEWGSGGIPPPTIRLGARKIWSESRPAVLPPVHIKLQAGWAHELVWAILRAKSVAPCRNLNPQPIFNWMQNKER